MVSNLSATHTNNQKLLEVFLFSVHLGFVQSIRAYLQKMLVNRHMSKVVGYAVSREGVYRLVKSALLHGKRSMALIRKQQEV